MNLGLLRFILVVMADSLVTAAAVIALNLRLEHDHAVWISGLLLGLGIVATAGVYLTVKREEAS